jgi:hypothetical protein
VKIGPDNGPDWPLKKAALCHVSAVSHWSAAHNGSESEPDSDGSEIPIPERPREWRWAFREPTHNSARVRLEIPW